MVDVLENHTEEWQRRQDRHKHNGFFGCTRMAQMTMRDIQSFHTTTDESRSIASEISPLLDQLYESLKKRREGT